MKKFSCALVFTVMAWNGQVQAETVLGVYAGADFWQSKTTGGFANTDQKQPFDFENESQQAYYLAFEHFVPVLPNIRIQYMPLETQGQTLLNNTFNFAGTSFSAGSTVLGSLDLDSTDYILYYELFDNPLLSLDLGLNAKHLKGDVTVATGSLRGAERLNEWLPMLYIDTKIGILATGLDVFASGSATRYNDSHLYDLQAGIGYQLVDNLLLDVRFKVGYRAMDLQLDDVNDLYADLEFKGVFAGVEIHF